MELGAKGSVQSLLMDRGDLPDPFVGTNEANYQWIEEEKWVFQTSFELTREELLSKVLELHFPNVDTYAELFINGEKVATCNNAFRPYNFNLKEVAKSGVNWVSLVFESPVNYHRQAYLDAETKFPAPNDKGDIPIAPYSRKPQFQFGWDWSMRMNTMGLWSPCKLVVAKTPPIRNYNIQTIELGENTAQIHFSVEFSEKMEHWTWSSRYFDKVAIFKSTASGKAMFTIENPKLWYPRGYGEQALYEDVWVFRNQQDEIIAEQPVQFGIRISELIQEPDSIGTSYEIHVNGKPVFCKGGNYIPQHVFPSKVSKHDVTSMIEQMNLANFNMVRVWGGGYYPMNEFYEACDSLGIMVWQDFMFACAMYPGDDAFLEVIEPEIDHQIQRIGRHPSVVLFNGNNEVDVAWKNWGFQAQYLILGKEAERIQSYYNRVFKTFIPSRINLQQTSVPYIHTSPLSNWGKPSDFNSGSQHYWGVWHGKDPIEDFGRKSGRFNAEYGFQSFPQMSTIAQFADSTELSLDSEVMKHHQKSYVGNQMIRKHADRLFGASDSFEDFVFKSQLTQAKAVSLAVASHRIQAPRCMGTIYWQVNDCWPAPTWSSIDHNGNWKALHYVLQQDFQDVTVLEHYEELGKEKYALSNMTGFSQTVEVKFTILNLSGDTLIQGWNKYVLASLAHKPLLLNDQKLGLQSENYLVEFEWRIEGTIEWKSRTFAHLPQPREKASKEEVALTVLLEPDGKSGVVVVQSAVFLHQFFLTSSSTPVKFEKNLMEIKPGNTRIRFTSNQQIATNHIQANWL